MKLMTRNMSFFALKGIEWQELSSHVGEKKSDITKIKCLKLLIYTIVKLLDKKKPRYNQDKRRLKSFYIKDVSFTDCINRSSRVREYQNVQTHQR